MWANGENFVDKIFNTNDAKFPQVLFDKSVVCDWDPLFVDFYKTTFVDQLTNTFQVWVAMQKKFKLSMFSPNSQQSFQQLFRIWDM